MFKKLNSEAINFLQKAKKFDQTKSPISINDIDINNIVVSNKLPFGQKDFKYSIGYKDSKKAGHLHIFCPQMITCKINFDEKRRIYF